MARLTIVAATVLASGSLVARPTPPPPASAAPAAAPATASRPAPPPSQPASASQPRAPATASRPASPPSQPAAASQPRAPATASRPTAVSLPAAGEGCPCPRPNTPGFEAGVVWRGKDPRLTLEQIAYLVAPILWFSPDEPLIARGDTPLPNPHPCDRPSPHGVVYYQADRIRLRGDREVSVPVDDDPALFSKAAEVVIRFFFYYREDIGLHSHLHDVEVAELHVVLDRGDDGCGQVRLESAIGFAHGVDWYFNRLVIQDDTRFPLTILVEEGKHASCPDRNADGYYSPGYDVNRRVNDAWGVRDVLGSGMLGTGGYQAWMTKPRTPSFRVLTPEVPLACVAPWYRSLARSTASMGSYELRRGDTLSMSQCPKPPPEAKFLASIMEANHLGREYTTSQHEYAIVESLSNPLRFTRRLIPSVALRYDRKLGLSFTLAGFDLSEIYIVPKFNYVRGNLSFEALVTGSAARYYSTYLSAGVGWEQLGELPDKDWHFVAEFGLRFRYRLTGWARIISLGYHFAGARFGIRTSGFDNLNAIRFVAEFGAGAW